MNNPELTPNTAEQCAADFLTAWQNKEYDKMLSNTQITWAVMQRKTASNKRGLKGPKQVLKTTFSDIELKSWEIIETIYPENEYGKGSTNDGTFELSKDTMTDVAASVVINISSTGYMKLHLAGIRLPENIEDTDIKKTLLLRCLKEKAAYKPDAKGAWGVNPISIFRKVKNN